MLGALPRRRRALAAVVALVLGGALTLASVPVVAAAVVHCCCGDHDAHDDCGCADCPAGHPSKPSGQHSVRSCVSVSGELPLAPPVAAVPSFIPLPPTELAVVPVAPPPHPLTDRLLDPPPSPPPRR